MLQSGEWWIDEDGQLTFADGDIGDVGHEAIAYCTALGLPLGEYASGEYDGPDFDIGERVFKMHPGDLGEDADGNDIPITPQNSLYAWLKENGVSKKALDFFGKNNADARVYAVTYMGWIRVKIHGGWGPSRSYGIEVDVQVLNDKALKHLRDAEFWGDDFEEAQDLENVTLTVAEQSTGKTHSFDAKMLFKVGSAAALKAYLARDVSAWHETGLDGLRGLRGDVVDHFCPAGSTRWVYHGTTLKGFSSIQANGLRARASKLAWLPPRVVWCTPNPDLAMQAGPVLLRFPLPADALFVDDGVHEVKEACAEGSSASLVSTLDVPASEIEVLVGHNAWERL